MLYLTGRRNKILQIIEEKRIISVRQLLEMIDASPATVRKDLTYLEKEGHVVRSRGEVSICSERPLPTFSSRSTYNESAKAVIAEHAVQFIKENDSVILDSGTTSYEIAKRLDGFHNLTVITTSLPICMYLSQNTNINVIMPGGTLHRDTNCLIGPETEQFFKNIEANIMFVSATGIRESEGLTLALPYETNTKINAIRAARTVCAVVDSTKTQRVCVNLFAKFSDLDYFITDKKPSDEMFETLKANGVEMIYPE